MVERAGVVPLDGDEDRATRDRIGRRAAMPVSGYSVMILSAHSTSDTKTSGLPNFAPHAVRSVSETPRAREHAPQENTGMCLATTFARVSESGGHPTGKI